MRFPCVYCLCLARWISLSTQAPVQSLTTAIQRHNVLVSKIQTTNQNNQPLVINTCMLNVMLCSGMPSETTTAICSMIFGGVLENFPNLHICFAHGGIEVAKFVSVHELL